MSCSYQCYEPVVARSNVVNPRKDGGIRARVAFPFSILHSISERPTARSSVMRFDLPLALLLPLLGVVASRDAVHVHTAAPRTRARFFLPEEPRAQQELQQFQQENALLLDQLTALGFEAFEAAGGAANGSDASWANFPRASGEIDLVWSLAASPPLEKLEYAMTFETKMNHLPGAARLAASDALYQHLIAQQKTHGKFFFHFMPAHYALPNDREALKAAFADVVKKVEFEPKRRRDPFIYQRFLLSEVPANGNEAASTSTRSAVFIREADLDGKLASNAFKDQTIQARDYIEPFLVDQHKFTVGFYVVVAGVDPLRIYVHSHPKIKIARGEYPRSLTVDADPETYTFDEYLAPWDLSALQSEFYEFPSESRIGTNAWHIVKKYMRRQGIDTKRVQDEIDAAIAKTIASSRGQFQQEISKLKRSKPAGLENAPEGGPSDLNDNFFELLKFDFEIDDNAKPWLIKVHSNPSLTPRQSTFGTDEAILKRVLLDTLNLVGSHPQAQLPFDKFFHPTDAKFCAQKCHDKNRAWDSACWSCPGWFPPYIARRLFYAMSEYTRRGQFNLAFPDLEKDYSRFLGTPLSEHDVAFDRYLKSISASYSDPQEFPVSERKVLCVYREHCRNHGDCINGVCSCDDNYEGNTCYIPKDLEMDEFAHQEQLAAERADHGAREAETWKEKVEHFMWKHAGTTAPPAANGYHHQDVAEAQHFSASKLVFAMAVLSAFLFGAYRVFLAFAPASVTSYHGTKSN